MKNDRLTAALAGAFLAAVLGSDGVLLKTGRTPYTHLLRRHSVGFLAFEAVLTAHVLGRPRWAKALDPFGLIAKMVRV